MQILIAIIACFLGAAIGGAIGWFVCQAKGHRLLAETEAERATLLERLRNIEENARLAADASRAQEARIQKLTNDAAQNAQKLGQYAQAYQAATQKVADRERSIEQFRADIESTETRIDEYRIEITDLEKQVSQYQEALLGERKLSEEKVESFGQQLAERNSAIEELRQQSKENECRVTRFQDKVTSLESQASQLQEALQGERKLAEEKLAVLGQAQTKLTDAFKSLAADALRQNSTSFLELANANLEKFQETAKGDLEGKQKAIDELVKPVKESLDKVDLKIQEMEKAREGAYRGLLTQVTSLVDTQKELRSETSNLVRALRAPHIRGRWGEIQLRRVVEMAGMLDHCDFQTQESFDSEDGRLRPDLIVKLPAEKNIVVDSKAPLSAYLDAIEATDDIIRKARMVDHAKQIRTHLTALGRKSYFEQCNSPEFVVMFLPGEAFFSASLEEDPSLIEFGVEQNVIIATPTTLIALLRAVAYGWRQEQLARNSQEICTLAAELYKRCAGLGKHFDSLGKSLKNAVESYNGAIGTLEARVLVTARRFEGLHASAQGVEIKTPVPIEVAPRSIQAPELIPVLSGLVENQPRGNDAGV